VDVNKENKSGSTSFLLAAQNGHVEIVRELLQDKRVDVNKRSDCGSTPFLRATDNGHVEVLKVLLQDKRIDIERKISLTANHKKIQEIDIMKEIDQLNSIGDEEKTALKKLAEGKIEETEGKIKKIKQETQDYSKINRRNIVENLLTAAAEGQLPAVKKMTDILRKKECKKRI
jgi:hypothetical protein